MKRIFVTEQFNYHQVSSFNISYHQVSLNNSQACTLFLLLTADLVSRSDWNFLSFFSNIFSLLSLQFLPGIFIIFAPPPSRPGVGTGGFRNM